MKTISIGVFSFHPKTFNPLRISPKIFHPNTFYPVPTELKNRVRHIINQGNLDSIKWFNSQEKQGILIFLKGRMADFRSPNDLEIKVLRKK